jgi:hypothetical protein
MKNIYTCLITMLLAISVSAQQNGWARMITSNGGGTNVFSEFAIDNNGNPTVFGGVEDYGGSAPNGFVIQKRGTDGSIRFTKKYNGNNGARAVKVIVDQDNNFYFVGYFYGNIAFGTDTLFTTSKYYWNRRDVIVAKFDQDGNYIWARNLGTHMEEDPTTIVDVHLAGNQLVMMSRFENDSVFYNNVFVEKIPFVHQFRRSYFITTINADGSLASFKKAGTYNDGSVFSFRVMGDGSYEMTQEEQAYLVKVSINAAVTSISRTDSIKWQKVPAEMGTTDLTGVKAEGDYYYALISANSAKGLKIGDDTLKGITSPYNLRDAFVLKLNSNMEYVGGATFHWMYNYPTIRFSRGKLIIQSRFLNTMYYTPGDSIICANNQHGHALIVMDTDFNVEDHFQVNTANSSGGSFGFRGAHFDASGNLYSQYVHNKNILFGTEVVQAALKSWDHLTVLCKREGPNGNPTGLADVMQDTRLSVYPNPSSGSVTVDSEAKVVSLTVTDLAGKALVSANSSQIDISQLATGSYLLSIQTAEGTSVKKLMKQ